MTTAPVTDDDFFGDIPLLNDPDSPYVLGTSKPVGGSIRDILTPDAYPIIEDPADDEVTLPGGLVTDDGVKRDAIVRELTGEDEEAMAKARNNPVRFLRALCKAVVSIGGEPVTPKVLEKLLVGDREMLILGIRCATYGATLDYKDVNCPGCGEDLDISLDLLSIDNAPLEDPEKREFEVDLKVGKAVVRLVTVADSDQVTEDSSITTSAETNTFLLSRCVISINGVKVNGNRDVVKKLGLKDRNTLLDFLAKTQPGPRYDEVKSTHDSCGTDIPLYLAIDTLFRGI